MIENILLLELERRQPMFPDTVWGFVSQAINESGFNCIRGKLPIPIGTPAAKINAKIDALSRFIDKHRIDLVIYHNIFDREIPVKIWKRHKSLFQADSSPRSTGELR